MTEERRQQRLRRYWDSHAGSYDRQMGFFDRHLFAGSRDWVCSRAAGQVLEVAVGTGLNLAHYPAGVRLTGIDHSPEMLRIARDRAGQLALSADLRQGDAQAIDARISDHEVQRKRAHRPGEFLDLSIVRAGQGNPRS